jgi:ATP-dependent protease HslVU (ClpYQ) peptidase subunit
MTCIIGLEADGKVYMGCDSASISGYSQNRTRLKKVFRVQNFLIGYTSSFRMGQILEHHLSVDFQPKSKTDMEYMVCNFAEGVREVLKEFGYARIENNEEEIGTFLVGYKNKLYCIHNNLQVNSNSLGVDSVGAGYEVAMGAMLAMPNEEPRKRIKKALQITEELSTVVCKPFHLLTN